MKQLLFFLILFTTSLHSQDYTKVDDIVSEYTTFSKVEDLAKKIAKDFTTDKNKARAVFFWLSKNIRYNLKEYYNPSRSYKFSYATEDEKQQKLQALKDELVLEVFKTKVGVCEDYAQAFKKTCDILGLESEVIKGNVRVNPNKIGKPEKYTNHAWNAVKINGNWLIIDATWAAGYEMNGKWIQKFDDYFYNIPKEKILKTHFSEDLKWRKDNSKFVKKEFYNQPIFSNSFLNSKATLINQKTGILKVNQSKEITLKLKKLDPNLLIYYTFKGQRYAKKPKISIDKNITTLTFLKAKRKSVLNIFINNEIAIQFKTK
ncbi:transglutaminase domain-containing protein [Polaribacter sp. Z022]|uniref:transglutaminase domain-containing protein n=1 Tax=Polaribacter sp. Z022 TaxID=2927125 RepID=UPI0020229257|nr:transglutaminase domain-containing protein [Polaribacter sp. Z022]MCL7753598.1 transglutaminase [Polaribacter sp. Z022]